jgi:hypothetical protein
MAYQTQLHRPLRDCLPLAVSDNVVEVDESPSEHTVVVQQQVLRLVLLQRLRCVDLQITHTHKHTQTRIYHILLQGLGSVDLESSSMLG